MSLHANRSRHCYSAGSYDDIKNTVKDPIVLCNSYLIKKHFQIKLIKRILQPAIETHIASWTLILHHPFNLLQDIRPRRGV